MTHAIADDAEAVAVAAEPTAEFVGAGCPARR